jgi:hypothetical protein
MKLKYNLMQMGWEQGKVKLGWSHGFGLDELDA